MIAKIASIIKPRFFAFVVLVSLVGVITLYFYAMSIEPQEVNISDIGWDDIGLTVSTRGFIKDARLSSALHITLLDIEGLDSILVYVPMSAYQPLSFKSQIVPGAELKVKGEVKEYNGQLEIFVQTHKSLTLVSKAKELILEIEDLAKSPELFKYLNVSVEGVVTHIESFYDSSGNIGTNLVLKKGKYNLNCIAYGTDMSTEIAVGLDLIFNGRFEYHENMLCWFLVDRR